MIKLFRMTLLVMIVLISIKLSAQVSDTDSVVTPDTITIVEEVMEEVVIEVNPIKETLDAFLPDTIGDFIARNSIRGNIETNLRGCFKSYTKVGELKNAINVMVSRNDRELTIRDSLPTGIIEKKVIVNGSEAIYKANSVLKSKSLIVILSDKIVVFSNRSDLSEADLMNFAKQLNYSLINSL